MKYKMYIYIFPLTNFLFALHASIQLVFVQQINNNINNKEKKTHKRWKKDEFEHLTCLRQSTCKNAIENDIHFRMYGLTLSFCA